MARRSFASALLSEISVDGQTFSGVMVFLVPAAKNLMSLSSIWSPPMLVECEDIRDLKKRWSPLKRLEYVRQIWILSEWVHVKQGESLEPRPYGNSVEASVQVVIFVLCKLVHPRE
jgi:hypothetical protein